MKRILLLVLLAVMLVSPALAYLTGTGTSTSAKPSLPVEWTFSADSTNEYYEFGFTSAKYPADVSSYTWDEEATSSFTSSTLSLKTEVSGQDVYATNNHTAENSGTAPCYVYWKIRSNKNVTLTLAVADSNGENIGSKLATTGTGTTDLDWIVLWTSGGSTTVIGSNTEKKEIGHTANYIGQASDTSAYIKSFTAVSDATTMRTEQGSQQIFISTDDVAKDQALGTYSGSLVLTISTSS